MDMRLRLKIPDAEDIELCELMDEPKVCYKSDVCTEIKSKICPIPKVRNNYVEYFPTSITLNFASIQ